MVTSRMDKADPQTYAAFLQMERKEFFHFHHMMVPLYYIQKTAKDNQTDILSEYLDILDGYYGYGYYGPATQNFSLKFLK